MSRFFLISGAVCAFCAVAFGAFGAHALKAILSASSQVTFHTANEYHMWHSLALIALGALGATRPDSKLLTLTGIAFLAGIILFSGSLYGLAISGISILGVITPVGGVAFLLGWASLSMYAFKNTLVKN